jgi:hypothetical protein
MLHIGKQQVFIGKIAGAVTTICISGTDDVHHQQTKNLVLFF